MRIVFFGTPDFAVATLKAIHEAGFDIVGVVTAPDKAAGRGMQLKMSAVKSYALSHHLPLAQPEKMRNPEFLDWLRNRHADLQVVVAFRMMPEVVWNMPPLGTYNVHASLLPHYRGAAPINWAIINGEKETGVTIFKLQHEIDTGPVLAQKSIAILPEDNAGSLHDKLMDIGAEAMVDVLKTLEAGTAKPIEQKQFGLEEIALKKAPKIFTETCSIDFTKTADEVIDLIRGLSPYPAAFATLDGKLLKIFAAAKAESCHGILPGSMKTDGKNTLAFATKDNWVNILDLQLQGKKRMDTGSFLRGYRFEQSGK